MSNFIESIERIDTLLDTSQVTTNLAAGTLMENCVPFSSWYRSVADSGLDNFGANLIDLFFVDNSGNDALRAQRSGNFDDIDIATYVVEFGSDCTVQQIDVTLTGVTDDITISTLGDIDKTFCVFYYTRDGGDIDAFDSAAVSWHIVDSTTVRLTRGANADGTVYGTLYVVEDTGTNFDVQHGDSALTQGVSNSDVITSVDMGSTFLIASSYNTRGNDDPDVAAIRVDLEDATHVRSIRGAAGGVTVQIKYQVIELTNGNVYRGLIDFDTTTDTDTAAHTEIDPLLSMAKGTTHSPISASTDSGNKSSDMHPDLMIRVIINGTDDGIIVDRLSSGDAEAHFAWEVIEWESGAAPINVIGSATTAVTTSASITKITSVDGSATTAVTTSASVTKETAIVGSATTAITTLASVVVAKPVVGSSTTAVTTSASITKVTTIAGEATTAVSTVGLITKETYIIGQATTAITTSASVVVAKPVIGSSTTAVTTDAKVTKTTKVAGSTTTNISDSATVTKETTIEGSATTNVSTVGNVEKAGALDVNGLSTTAITTSASITKVTSILGSSQTNISTAAQVTKETAVAGSATTGISTAASVIVVKPVIGAATTAVATSVKVTKDTPTIGAATTDVTAIGSITVIRNISGSATTAIQAIGRATIPTGGLPMLSFLSIIADGTITQWEPQPDDGTDNWECVAPGTTPPDRSHWVFTDLTAKLDKYVLTNVPDNLDRINYMRMYFDFTGIDLGLIPGIRVQLRLDDIIFDIQKDLQLVSDLPNTVMVEWDGLDYDADVFRNATKVELWMYSISAAGAPPPEDPDYIPGEQ